MSARRTSERVARRHFVWNPGEEGVDPGDDLRLEADRDVRGGRRHHAPPRGARGALRGARAARLATPGHGELSREHGLHGHARRLGETDRERAGGNRTLALLAR